MSRELRLGNDIIQGWIGSTHVPLDHAVTLGPTRCHDTNNIRNINRIREMVSIATGSDSNH